MRKLLIFSARDAICLQTRVRFAREDWKNELRDMTSSLSLGYNPDLAREGLPRSVHRRTPWIPFEVSLSRNCPKRGGPRFIQRCAVHDPDVSLCKTQNARRAIRRLPVVAVFLLLENAIHRRGQL